jgi:hypothetical protein
VFEEVLRKDDTSHIIIIIIKYEVAMGFTACSIKLRETRKKNLAYSVQQGAFSIENVVIEYFCMA